MPAANDVNLDGEVNSADVVTLVNIILGKEPTNPLADIDGNTIVNLSDVTTLVNLLSTEGQ